MVRVSVGQVRAAVISRDAGCVARRVDPKAGPCRDQWGHTVLAVALDALEMDYVRHGARHGRHGAAADHVALCPGHHRGTGAQRGYVWATNHRAQLRAYLESMEDEG